MTGSSPSERMQSFREAFRGYNKSDVNEYIEKSNQRFSQAETKYKEEIERLKKELSSKNSDRETERISLLNDEVAKLTDELKTARESLDKLNAEKDAAVAASDKSDIYEKMSSELGNVLILANNDAERMISDAQKKSDEMIENAKKEADDIRSEAKIQAEKLINSVNEKLRVLSASCIDEYSTAFEDFRTNLKKLTDTMTEKTATLRSDVSSMKATVGKQLEEQFGEIVNKQA